MDALTSVLREMRFESVGYRWLDPVSPFSLDFDQHQLRGVHAVREGSCELVLADGTTEVLRAGDVAVLPRGDSHVLRSNDADDPCLILCGAFVVRESEHPVLAALPHLIRLQQADEPAVGSLIDALGAEARDASPGSDVVMARLSDALVVQALRHHARAASDAGWLGGLPTRGSRRCWPPSTTIRRAHGPCRTGGHRSTLAGDLLGSVHRPGRAAGNALRHRDPHAARADDAAG